MRPPALLVAGLVCAGVAAPGAEAPARLGDSKFFAIGEVQVVKYAPKAKGRDAPAFTPHLRVRLTSAEALPGNTVFARVHYFDERRDYLMTESAPLPETYDDVASAFPAFTPAGREPLIVRFNLPARVSEERNWSCVIEYGDEFDQATVTYPGGARLADYVYPDMAARLTRKPAARTARKISPVIEYVSNTGVAECPKLTFFLKKPPGVERASEARGVLAVCMLANAAADVRRRLEWEDLRDDYMHILDYAKRRGLLVVAWGSRKVWDGSRNTWEMSPAEAADYDRRMDMLAKAWEKGLGELAAKAGFKPENMLLWGYSASAQYAHRLALRRPNLFRAVYLHIPSSFDTPRRDAAKVMWCVTTGERDHGYAGSLAFHARWRDLGAISFHKAVPRLGHSDSGAVHHLARRFFDFALNPDTAAARAAYDHPPAYGDTLNGDIALASTADWIPNAQRVPLPDTGWSDAWELKPEPPPPPEPKPPAPIEKNPPRDILLNRPPATARENELAYRAELRLAQVMRENGFLWPDPKPPSEPKRETPPPAPEEPVVRSADPDNTPFGRRPAKTPDAP